MPFEFVCPFCYTKTKVPEEYLGQSGPCVNCGRHVVMPTRNQQGVLIASVQTGQTPKKVSQPLDGKQRAMSLMIGLAVLFLVVVSLASAAWFALPSIQRGISIAAQRRDLDNMRSIVSALNDYNARYGTYPTPVVTDATGKKLYSWRVLILPFMGYEDLYKRFQLNQAWDSPANIALLPEMPKDFASPNSPSSLSNYEANYVLLVGPGTVFPPAGPLAKNKISDAPTILVAETNGGKVVWTEPGDIDVGVYGAVIGNQALQSIGGHHRNHALVVDSDGVGYRLPNSVPQQVLDAIVTPDRGEKVDLAEFED